MAASCQLAEIERQVDTLLAQKVTASKDGFGAVGNHVKKRSVLRVATAAAELSVLRICRRESMREAKQGDQV